MTTMATRTTATNSRRSRSRLLTASLCIALIASACSSDASDIPTDAEASPPETAAAIDEPGSAAPLETSPSVPTAPEADPSCDERIAGTVRVDIGTDGNRVHPGRLDLAAAEAFDVNIDGTPEWILPDPTAEGSWYVLLTDGPSVRVLADGTVEPAPRAPSGPPMLSATGEPLSIFIDHQRFDAPLTDGRVVAMGDLAVMLSDGTDRYAHQVLGDAIEGGGIAWVNMCTGDSATITIAAPDVIEGTAPMLADVDEDGEVEILVTLSNANDGARLAVFEFDGTLLAESEPIGQGNRWRNQLAIGPLGPNGELEIVDVRTPHIGGTVQAFQLADDGRLERVAASSSDYTSHVIGSRNLDMGIAVDANGDGRLDVIVARSDRRQIVALTRTDDSRGWESIAERSLDAPLTTNIAVQDTQAGTDIAVGHEGRIRIWRG